MCVRAVCVCVRACVRACVMLMCNLSVNKCCPAERLWLSFPVLSDGRNALISVIGDSDISSVWAEHERDTHRDCGAGHPATREKVV